MTITDNKKGIKIEVQTSLVSTNYKVAFYELAAIIGQFMSQNDMTNESFIKTFLSDNEQPTNK